MTESEGFQGLQGGFATEGLVGPRSVVVKHVLLQLLLQFLPVLKVVPSSRSSLRVLQNLSTLPLV